MKKFFLHIESGEVYPEFLAPAGYQAANPHVWQEVTDSDAALTAAPEDETPDAPEAIPHKTKKVKANAGPDSA